MVVATGFFDGVHLGHRQVIAALTAAARERGTGSVVATFWPHPRTVLQQDAGSLRLLSTLEEKRSMLSALGVDRVEVLPFSREFSRISAQDYLRDVVKGRLGATAVLIGYDNRMGHDSLSPDETAALASSLGLEVIRVGACCSGDSAISSTRIRRSISDGDVSAAARMLGYRYALHGVVVSGNRLGRTLGFPTANMQLYEPLKLIPGRGVYRTEVEVLGHRYKGMTNIGLRPTMTTDRVPVVETHILDFDEDIYGLDIRVTFIEKLRDEVHFDSADLLREQLVKDKQLCDKAI